MGRRELDPYTLLWCVGKLRGQLCSCADAKCTHRRLFAQEYIGAWRERARAIERKAKVKVKRGT